MYEKTTITSPDTGYYMYHVTRVPGGWIFAYNDGYAVFVPNTQKQFKMTDKEIVQKQLEFVEWLKEKGIYNVMETAATMQKMHRVWEKAHEDCK